MATEPYPELEAIPPAPARSSSASGNGNDSGGSSLFPVPPWIVKMFSAFPLHTWPAAELVTPPRSAPPTRPVLYVAPHLERDGSASCAGWASADAECLRWQMELLFRGVQFDVQFIQPAQSWGPDRQLPFLHLPPEFQPPAPRPAPAPARSWLGSTTAAAAAVPPALLTPSALPAFLDNHFPTYRPELGEKRDAGSPWPDRATELESRTWDNLLRGRVMAGVLLAVLTSRASSGAVGVQAELPLLTGLLASQMQTTVLDDQLRRIAALNPKGASEPLSHLPGWQVGFMSWIGAATASSDAGTTRQHDVDASVDEEAVMHDAVAGLEALGQRTEEQHGEWLLGATKPTSVDALAFAAIHTVLSYAATPQAQAQVQAQSRSRSQLDALLRLKTAIEKSPWLVQWSRRVWREYVKPRESESAE